MPDSDMTLAWAVLLFAAGLGLGWDIWGAKWPLRKRVTAVLVHTMVGLMAGSNIVPLSHDTRHTITYILCLLVAAASLVTMLPELRRTTRP